MYKKLLIAIVVLAVGIAAGALAADCSMTGSWVFDMNGMSATVEYKADGTLAQDMFGMQVTGTYTVKGNKLTTVVGDTTTVFTIVTCTPECRHGEARQGREDGSIQEKVTSRLLFHDQQQTVPGRARG